MPAPTQARRRRALAILLVAGLGCLMLPEAVKGPILSAAAPILRPMASARDAAKRRLALWLDVGPDAELRREAARLQADLVRAEAEGMSLRRQLRGTVELAERVRPARRGMPAHVIGRDTVPWRRSLFLDRGSADGVRGGEAVLCGGRMVGRVTAPTATSCRVQCINDGACRIWVLIGRGLDDRPDAGRVQAVAQGAGGRMLRLLYCQRPGDVRPGDPVVTSGYDERDPAGIWVGTVTRVEGQGEAASVEVEAACDLLSFEEAVILLAPQAAP